MNTLITCTHSCTSGTRDTCTGWMRRFSSGIWGKMAVFSRKEQKNEHFIKERTFIGCITNAKDCEGIWNCRIIIVDIT